jgi:hypothetical protein
VPVADADGTERRFGRALDRRIVRPRDLDLDRYDRCSRDA